MSVSSSPPPTRQRTDGDDIKHAGVHVIEEVAVKCPVSRVICREVEAQLASRQHVQSVLQRVMPGMAVYQLHEVAVEVNGVLHHSVVDERDADPLIEGETERLHARAEFLTVERPHEALHVAGEMDLHVTRRSPLILVWLECIPRAPSNRALTSLLASRAKTITP